MPNFTEGDWEVSGTVIWVPVQVGENDIDQMPIAEAATESDARLMAQSKKMYEAINKATKAYAECGHIDNIDCLFFDDFRAIISEIDKE